MDQVLRVLGTLLIVDMAAAVVLAGLVVVIGRRGRTPVPMTTLLGVLIFLGLCSLLIYGGLWMMLRN